MKTLALAAFGALLFLAHALGFSLLWSVFVLGAFILAGLVLLYSANLPVTREKARVSA